MSASVQTVQDILARRNQAAPLSQSVVAGIVGILALSAVVIAALVIMAILGRVSFNDTSEIAAIGLCALLLLLGLHAAGSYDFRAIMNPARRLATTIAVCSLVFLVL